ncbi:MAG: type II toxin-antitoxin system HicB family antitoxin [Pseudomonadota bacterium]
MPTYVALLRKDPDSDFSVNFHDFPGCITAGATLKEAWNMAHEALAFHVEGMLEDGDEIPEPSSLDLVMLDPNNADALPFLVTVPIPAPAAHHKKWTQAVAV